MFYLHTALSFLRICLHLYGAVQSQSLHMHRASLFRPHPPWIAAQIPRLQTVGRQAEGTGQAHAVLLVETVPLHDVFAAHAAEAWQLLAWRVPSSRQQCTMPCTAGFRV